MIKTNAQRERTLVQIAGFQRALNGVDHRASKRSIAIRRTYEQVIRELEHEVGEYDRLRSGRLNVPPLDRLDHIASFVAKMRLSNGMSQTELAKRLHVRKQVISRLEESDYQTAGIQTLQSVLDALGVKIAIRLKAPRPRRLN